MAKNIICITRIRLYLLAIRIKNLAKPFEYSHK